MTKRQVVDETSTANLNYEISEDLIKWWIFNSIFKKYQPATQEEAEELITKKRISTRVITSWGISYITLIAYPQKLIAQAREDYFLVPRNPNELWTWEYKDQSIESPTQSTNKTSTQTDSPKKKSSRKSEKQKSTEIL